MKFPRLSRLLIAAAFIAPVIARAHPGHDGDHDFVWDFGHLADHPFGTFACVSLLAAGGWGVWRLLKAHPNAKTERVRRD